MQDSFLDIVFFALLAGFLAYKLYTTLGKEDIDDKTNIDKIKNSKDNFFDAKVVENTSFPQDITEKALITLNKNPKIISVFTAINSYDKNFSEETFLKGAKKAFEIILKAFCEGKKEVLKNLLSREVLAEFEREIEARNDGNYSEKTLISLDKAEIVDANLDKTIAKIKVNFHSKQINIIRNQQGEIISGNPSSIDYMEDMWTFQRDISSKNPNWILISTAN